MSQILIIDDEAGIRQVLGDILEDEKFSVLRACDGPEGLSLLKTNPVDLVFLDVWMPNMGGLDVLKSIKADWPDLSVIMISGHSNIDMAVRAIKSGAFDFVEKPLSYDKVVTLTKNALKMGELNRENKELRSNLFLEDKMIGESAALKQVREMIRQSAQSDTRVMILGENGTGKELAAREIHLQSSRSRKPFVEVNCAAIPDNLIESELFGHEKGSFTGAASRRKGKFELADGGTLFLDEVADMSLSAQAKVLRAIQEQRFERVGGEESVSVDLRVIGATNKDLKSEVSAGRFREDLYFRLNVIVLNLPALRDRLEDLPQLIEYFFKRFKQKNGRSPARFSPEALNLLKAHSWPGNIRELKNFLERISVMTDETEVSIETAKFYLGEPQVKKEKSFLDGFLDLPLNTAKDAFEKAFIEEKFKENGGNITKTAMALGLYPSNLHSKLKKYGIEGDK